MKPFTSFILCSATTLIAYEVVRSINASQRLHNHKYRMVSVYTEPFGYTKKMYTKPGQYKPIYFEFDDALVVADSEEEMKKIYNDKVIKRCLPSFVK